MKIDSFVLAIMATVGLAYFLPEPAHLLPLEEIASIGVSLVFLFYGIKLSPEKLRSGLKNWKLHVVIQTFTFLVFPLVVLAIKPIFDHQNDDLLWLGLFFLAALPSTVSSSVVMVSIAKGNIPAAIFNASISGLIGIFITPLWMSLFAVTGNADVSEIYIKLLTEILIPIVLGFILQKWLANFVQKHSARFSTFDKSVILIIIYKSFVHSFESNVFFQIKPIDLFLISVWVLELFLLIYGLIMLTASWLKFNREDRITALFCGTKKSLVHGTVFSKVIFGNSASIGIILLPLMLFHAFQILIISAIASRKN